MDVESYYEFLPWCKGARVIENAVWPYWYDKCKKNSFGKLSDLREAELYIEYALFKEKMHSYVALYEHTSRNSEYKGMSVVTFTNKYPFSMLESVFCLDDMQEGGCRLVFEISFDINNIVLGALIKRSLPSVSERIIRHFEQRVNYKYVL